jgi:phosphoribosylaminoimidazole-succinocarboxamide synthase
MTMNEKCFSGFTAADLPAGVPLYTGKVRDVMDLGDRLLITVSDRISAFDRVLSTIPFKGEVLSRVSAGWFEATADVIPNHVLETLTARTTAFARPGCSG